MKRNPLLRAAAAVILISALAPVFAVSVLAQDQTQDQPSMPPDVSNRPAQVDLFGGSTYTGGHLKYSYKVSREGVDGYSITTTEITPQDDGTYLVENSSSDIVSLEGVNIGFFGIPLRGLGFRISTSNGGTVDLSPLSALEDTVLEPNKEYVLPDGGDLVAGDEGTIAGVDVVYATYTQADYTNVEVHLAMPTDSTIRNLLPLFPYLELQYTSDPLPEQGADEGYRAMHSFSKIELIDFEYEQ
jgi:hypothetical protein